MGVSADGYVSRGPDDDMSWLGPVDKKVFRILTGVGGKLACGFKTSQCMPEALDGREVAVIRSDWRKGPTIDHFNREHPDGWLVGGQHIAVNAIAMGLVTEAHICVSSRKAFPDGEPLHSGDICLLGVAMKGIMTKAMETRLLDVNVEVWRRG